MSAPEEASDSKSKRQQRRLRCLHEDIQELLEDGTDQYTFTMAFLNGTCLPLTKPRLHSEIRALMGFHSSAVFRRNFDSNAEWKDNPGPGSIVLTTSTHVLMYPRGDGTGEWTTAVYKTKTAAGAVEAQEKEDSTKESWDILG